MKANLYSSITRFQWVVCQMKPILNCFNPSQLRKTLNGLPKTLYDTYAVMLGKFEEEHYELALRMFHWVLFAERPLSIENLAELVAMDLSEDAPKIESLWDTAECSMICPGFFTTVEEQVDDKNDERPKILVRVAHTSIREYLLSRDLENSNVFKYLITNSKAQSEIAKCCLHYMLLLEQRLQTAVQNSSLADYTVKYWLRHYENC